MKILNQLKELVHPEDLYINEEMSKRTTFRIGGPADAFINVTDVETLQAVLKLCQTEDVAYTVLGNGSNVLVGDKGYRGVILHIGKGLSYIEVEGDKIRAGGGTILAQIAAVALKKEFAGFEFAAGIPGTVGGACVMNAGAYGGEMKHVLESITVLDPNGMVKEIQATDLNLGYRTSIIPKEGYMVLEVVLAFEKGDPITIKGLMDEYRDARVSKQPLSYPSAGSTFKRPTGYFAGKLIDDVGMRGYQVGGAQVSEKHCGFVINTGDATAAHVRQLMKDVQDKVMDEFQVELEAEVKFIGEF